MKYQSEILINLPRARVVELFDDPTNLAKWQKGLQSFEAISGTPGQPGAKSKLVFDTNGRKMEMTETVLTRNLPDEFSGTYEAPGVYNIVKNFFHEAGPSQTRYVSDQEFQFSGYMRLLAPFLSGAFRKQTMTFLRDFKAFAEAEGPGASSPAS
ncbi:MAG: SRPBCC family protein [Caldilineaceae bacterium]